MLQSDFDWSEGLRGSLSWMDYLVFVWTLILSLAIGVFYAFQSRDKANDEFLLAGKSLGCFPVSMSLLASYISAILLLGGPSEAYYHGIQWWVVCLGQVILPVAALVFMPFFYELQLTSIYEYLELRYSSRTVRYVASGLYVIQTLLYQAVVIYAPAFALASVSDFPLWSSVISVGFIASFYTAIGGIKAVVWTDVLQLFILVLGLLVVIFKGIYDMGGFWPIWKTAVEHDRAGSHIFVYEYDPMERHTVPNLLLSSILGKLYVYVCTQTSIQRYTSTKTLAHAYVSIFMIIPFMTLIVSLTMLTGLVIFATYEGCDPLAAGLITKIDQILPFYVMDRMSSIPGLPGIFIACIFSGSLSTISSGVNAQAAVTWEDVFSRRHGYENLAKTTQAQITKFLALGYGVLATFLALFGNHIDGILQVTIAITSSASGPILAAFMMALFLPFANAKGATTAMVIGTAITFVFSIGPIILDIRADLLPTSTDLCPANLTIPPPDTTYVSVSDLQYPLKMFGLSYTQLCPLGFAISFVTGIIISLITGRSNGVQIDEKLVHPWVRWSLKNNKEINIKTRLISKQSES